MSGGHFNYLYCTILDTYKNQMESHILNWMLEDFCALLKELEWYKSADTSKEQYKKAANKFIKKWIHSKESAKLEYKHKVIQKFQKVIDKLNEEVEK